MNGIILNVWVLKNIKQRVKIVIYVWDVKVYHKDTNSIMDIFGTIINE
jgi:hypothetical protein